MSRLGWFFNTPCQTATVILIFGCGHHGDLEHARSSARVTTPATQQSPASARARDIAWKGQFGSCKADPATVYCLMGSGFLLERTSDNIELIVSRWIEEHPDARIVPIARFGPISDTNPHAILEFVWIVDGDSNLNLELVRNGACPAGTMLLHTRNELLVSSDEYENFATQLTGLEQRAQRDQLGIWK